ncbi:MAG: hypothetical protein ABR576_12355 [Thermoanaerobaculia bacterium]
MSEPEIKEPGREPWLQDGRYIRDADRNILVRAKSPADARRIVAAINAVQGIPTEALESWNVQVLSDPGLDPGFDVEFDFDDVLPVTAVMPPEARVFERRAGERRQGDRRQAQAEFRSNTG